MNEKLLHSLITESEFVKFNELLPSNRTPSVVNEDESIVRGASAGHSKIKSNTGKKNNRLFHVPVSHIFCVHGLSSRDKSRFSIPLARYNDHISQRAHPNRKFSVSQWYNYDKHYPLHIARNHADRKLWYFWSELAWIEYLSYNLRPILRQRRMQKMGKIAW